MKKITKQEYNRIKITFESTLEMLKENIATGCEACQNWNGTGCIVADGRTPPQNVQQNGCPSFIENEAPI